MNEVRRFTAMIYREDGGYVALRPELDVAGPVKEIPSKMPRRIFREAAGFFRETADPSEVEGRMREEMYVTALEVTAG